MKKTYNLNIVAALPCEAQILNEHFQLKKILRQATIFPIFTNKYQNIHLVISGIGKVNTAAAVAYLNMFTGSKAYTGFMNIGIAGSIEFGLGQAVLINKVIDTAVQRSWYPFIGPLKYPVQGTLHTFDQPQLTYPPMGLVDMEGSAFFQAASCFVTQEQIQILKVISDCDNHTQQSLTPAHVANLMRDNLESIIAVADYLIDLSRTEAALEFHHVELEQFQKTWHFTHSQELELKNYLQRWQNLQLGSAWDACRNEKNPTRVIKMLIAKLDKLVAKPCYPERSEGSA